MIREGKRVLIVLYYYYPYISGVSIYAKRLAEGLSKLGYKVTILTSRFDKSFPAEEVVDNIKIIRRPVLLKLSKGVIMPTFWFDIIRYARRNDYVNQHLPMVEGGLSSLFIPKEKIITTYHCDINLINGLLDRLILVISYFFMHMQLKRSKIIVPSSHDYFINSKMKKYSAKSFPIYPPIVAADFENVDSKSLMNKLKLSTSPKKVGFVGRIVYEKGIEYLLESTKYLIKKYPDIKIIIAGDYEKVAGGSIKENLDKYIKKYSNNIIFTGYLSDEELKQFYSMIDVLVLPSFDPLEAFGMVQVEAMLCGSPVIASDMPGVREVINRSGHGLLSKLKNPKDISNKILEVLENKEKYTPDREIVIEKFGSEKTISQYVKLFK